MPKEKTTTRKAKGKAASEGGKRKKGKSQSSPAEAVRQVTQSLDPNAPKRGLSAYMFFANEQRDNVREENPGISFGKLPLLRLVPVRSLLPCPDPLTVACMIQGKLARCSGRDGRL